MKKSIILFFLLTFFSFAKDYTRDNDVISFINTLIQKYDLKKETLEKLFLDVQVQHTALRAFTPSKKQKRLQDKRTPQKIKQTRKYYQKYGSWERYSRQKLNNKQVKRGVAFLKKYQDIFLRVEKKYGVPKEYIAAIIGIETNYGSNVGKYPVFDTLTTLAFEKNRRNNFFKKELEKFIQLSYTQKFNPKNVYGSYAGAIGLGQFMPSNYDAYGVDFNGDGRITLQNPYDAIASIANYLKKNGWHKGELVATRVSYKGTRFSKYETGYEKTYKQGTLEDIRPKKTWDYKGKVRLIKLTLKKYDELWYGAKNFFVITRYNHSAYYAMSVHQLAEKLKETSHEN